MSDNILVAFESLLNLQKYNSSKDGFMAIKLDMSKPYNKVEWSLLEAIMRKMRFVKRWIKLLMVCLITASRGIRQGDPLFPFLFLISTEGLHCLIS